MQLWLIRKSLCLRSEMVARVRATKRVPLNRLGKKLDNGGTGSFYRCHMN
jgi:hypothetical protein